MVEKILDKTGLNWEVEELPLVGLMSQGENEKPKGHTTEFRGVFRTDNYNCLGCVGHRYKSAQNSDLAELIVKFFGSKLKISKVDGGELQGGKRVYLTVEGDDLFKGTSAHMKQRMIISDSHDGKASLKIGFQDLVLVCTNGMTRWMARKDIKSKASIRHTASIDHKLSNFEEIYADFMDWNIKKKDMFEAWMSTKVSMDLAKKFIGQLNNVDMKLSQEDFIEQYSPRKWRAVEAQMQAMEVEFARQGASKWGLLNGITNYTTHSLGGDKKDAEEKRTALIDGAGYKLNNDAFELIQAL